MIIKVMTRKEPSFRQLIDYVSKDASDARYVLTHNLMAFDHAGISAEFEANARLLRGHVNGTVMFHDILSITRSKSLGLERQKEILKDIARDYIARRAPDHLVFAGLHEDHAKHLHYHFVISANPVGEWKRTHLSKPQLRTLQTEIEARVLTRYPDLEQKPTMSRRGTGPKLSQPGQELMRRTGKVPERQRVRQALAAILHEAQDEANLFKRLTDAKLELYRRGKSTGVRDLDTGRNHRLETLGLGEAFESMSSRLQGAHARAANTAPAIPRPASPPPLQTTKEPDMDLLQAALQGVSALVDTLSITTDLGKPIEDQKRKIQSAAQTIIKPAEPATIAHTTRPPPTPHSAESETERIARERLSDIAATRDEQDHQRNQSQDQRLSR